MKTLYYHIHLSLTCSISSISYTHFTYCISTSFIQLYPSTEFPSSTLRSGNLIFSQEPKLLAAVILKKNRGIKKNFFFRLHIYTMSYTTRLTSMAGFLVWIINTFQREKRRLEIYQNLITPTQAALMQHSCRHFM